MDKKKMYTELMKERKTCNRCIGLKNPSTENLSKFDSDQIGPWSLWQGNLDAKIVVVGQDWGDVDYFTKWKGRDQPSGNPTNENLQELLKCLDIKIGKPQESQHQLVFFTNIILCLKPKGLQAPVDDQWFNNCSFYFFKPLMSIIKPTVIIALGKKISESILTLYGKTISKNEKYSTMLNHSPFQLTTSSVLFPVYHCGAKGVNINRSMLEQQADWLKIYKWLRTNVK